MKHVGILIALCTIMTFGSPVMAHDGNSNENFIHACVNGGGLLRVVPPTGNCKSGETALHWVSTPTQDFFHVATGPRFVDLGQTVYDTITGLQWEKKTEGPARQLIFALGNSIRQAGVEPDEFGFTFLGPSPHDVNIRLPFCNATGLCEPPAHSWMQHLNDMAYAGFFDWRAPTLEEMQTIGNTGFNDGGTRYPDGFVSCGGFSSLSCMADPLFEPNALELHWTSTRAPGGAYATLGGTPVIVPPNTFLPVRAVRGPRQ